MRNYEGFVKKGKLRSRRMADPVARASTGAVGPRGDSSWAAGSRQGHAGQQDRASCTACRTFRPATCCATMIGRGTPLGAAGQADHGARRAGAGRNRFGMVEERIAQPTAPTVSCSTVSRARCRRPKSSTRFCAAVTGASPLVVHFVVDPAQLLRRLTGGAPARWAGRFTIFTTVRRRSRALRQRRRRTDSAPGRSRRGDRRAAGGLRGADAAAGGVLPPARAAGGRGRHGAARTRSPARCA